MMKFQIYSNIFETHVFNIKHLFLTLENHWCLDNIFTDYKNLIADVWGSRHSVQGERLVLQPAQAGVLHPALRHHLPPDQVTPCYTCHVTLVLIRSIS